MYYVGLLDNLTPSSPLGQRWEEIVRSNQYAGFMQSLAWARAKRLQGVENWHVGLFTDASLSNLIGGAIFFHSRKQNGAGIIIAPEGPVLPWDKTEEARIGLGQLLDFAESHAAQMGVMAMRIEPRLPAPIPPLFREFNRGPVDLVPRETSYIDIDKDFDDILASMKPKGRYNVKVAQKHGVTTSVSRCQADVNRFYSIVEEASLRDQFALEPPNFFEHVASTLFEDGTGQFVFAEKDGQTLAAMLLITYGNRATYLYGGISNANRQLMAGYALQMEGIKEAKSKGCQIYDLYGIEPHCSLEHRYGRFSQFKSQFGGQIQKFIGSQEIFFIDNLADAFVKAVAEAKLPI